VEILGANDVDGKIMIDDAVVLLDAMFLIDRGSSGVDDGGRRITAGSFLPKAILGERKT
jgi:hypothetical protein